MVVLLIACLFSAALSPLSAFGAEPIRLGILAFPFKAQALAQWQPLTVVLKQAMPERDFVVVALSQSELNQAVESRQLDFVLTNGGQYVLLRNRYGLSSPLATLASNGNGHSLTVAGGVIFSRVGQSRITTLSDIKGKTVAAVATESLEAYQMQAYELRRVGIRLPQDVKLLTTGLPHDQVVEAVLAGRADVGFLRSGVLEAMVRDSRLDINQLNIINPQVFPDFPFQVSTRLYPWWPFAAMPHVDENIARHVAAALFKLEDNTAVTSAMGMHGFVVPADYRSVEDVLRELRMPPFEVVPPFTLQDVWVRYRWQTMGALLTSGVILLLGVSLLLMYRILAVNYNIVLLHQQKLQESEEKFRTVADYTYDWEIWEDPAGTCLYCSPSCERVTGYSAEAFMTDSGLLARLICHEDLPLWKAHYADEHDVTKVRKITKAHANQLEFRILHQDGEVRWIGHICYHVYDAEGRDLGRRISNRDITERKKTAEALRQSVERFRDLVESMNDWIWEVDRNGRYTYVSPKVETLLGYKQEEVLGKSPFDFMPPDEGQRVGKVFGETIAKRAPLIALENTNLHKNGRLVVLETSAVPFFDLNGKFCGYRGIDRDITERMQMLQALEEANLLLEKELVERKAAEQELQVVNEQLSILLDSLPIAIHRSRAEGDFALTYMSHNVVTVTGYEPGDFIEKSDLWITHIHPDDAPGIDSGRTILFEKGANTYEYRWLAADGSYRWIQDSRRLIWFEDGTPSYIVGIWQDITERKQVEEKIRRLNDELGERVQARTKQLLEAQEELVRKEKLALLGQVAGSVGHELRNPLGVMNNAVYFLQTVLAEADETTREYLNIIKNEIADADRIVSDLLDAVRTMEPQPVAVDVRELIGQTLRRYLLPSTMTVTLEIPETLPPVWVDAEQMQQVFRNLISNGVEAMAEGGTLAISALENRQEDTVTVHVRDNGSGMTPEVLAKIFQPLFTTKARGIGLGLVVVKNLTRANRGTIMVQSEVGQGTTFTVTLPAMHSSLKGS